MTGGLLLHICCGPCSCYPLKKLLFEGRFSPIHLYFYNPNIQPPQEYERRRDTLAYLGAVAGKLFERAAVFTLDFADYKPSEFLSYVEGNIFTPHRCRLCYRLRLRKSAERAKELGFRKYSTTLLYSGQQKHDVIREEGQMAGEEFGVSFLYEDFRVGLKEGRAIARQIGLYRQKYCGCIYGLCDSLTQD